MHTERGTEDEEDEEAMRRSASANTAVKMCRATCRKISHCGAASEEWKQANEPCAEFRQKLRTKKRDEIQTDGTSTVSSRSARESTGRGSGPLSRISLRASTGEVNLWAESAPHASCDMQEERTERSSVPPQEGPRRKFAFHTRLETRRQPSLWPQAAVVVVAVVVVVVDDVAPPVLSHRPLTPQGSRYTDSTCWMLWSSRRCVRSCRWPPP